VETLQYQFKNTLCTINIGREICGQLLCHVKKINPSKLLLIVDNNIQHTYVATILDALQDFLVIILKYEGGEASKSLTVTTQIFDVLLANEFDRQSVVISLGGGTVGDIGGFVSSIYLRGINYIQMPTTLLAQADASIGGKTGINYAGIKNVIGTFYHPSSILCDIDILKSLPARQIRSGLAEIVRISLTHDESFFNWLEENYQKILLTETEATIFAIKRAVELKAQIVQQDERDITKVRALLNFGHTFGHALESCTGFSTLLHGEAVSIGICIALRISYKLNFIPLTTLQRIIQLLQHIGLPTLIPSQIEVSEILQAIKFDKKTLNKKINLIVLTDVGYGRILEDVDFDLITEILKISYQKEIKELS
jgi:3-dehydroquinate synthase